MTYYEICEICGLATPPYNLFGPVPFGRLACAACLVWLAFRDPDVADRIVDSIEGGCYLDSADKALVQTALDVLREQGDY